MPVTVLRRGNPNKNTISTYPVEFYHRCFFPSFFGSVFLHNKKVETILSQKVPKQE